jgi:hypothetical protein
VRVVKKDETGAEIVAGTGARSGDEAVPEEALLRHNFTPFIQEAERRARESRV